MRRKCLRSLAPLLLLLGIGLPSVWGATETAGRASAGYREKASALEAQGDLPQALFAWRVVAALDPDNAEAHAKIRTLVSALAQAAAEHYKQGVACFRAHELEKARTEFLTTLRLNPDHAQARFYLKKRIHQPDAPVYTVQPGDSFTQIASRQYGDPHQAAVIAYFNDLDPGKPLLIDTLLLLPQLEGVRPLPYQEIDAVLERAQQALNEKKYSEVWAITAGLGETNQGRARIQALNDAAFFGQGVLLMEQKQYRQALELLGRISPDYKGRDRAIQQARHRIQAQATEEKLRLAQDKVKEGAYKDAILMCNQLLEENPGSPKVQALREAAYYALGKQYLDRGEEVLAMETLKGLKPEYRDTAQLQAQAQGRLNARAEEFYRKGVKHFLNEELEEAVKAWQKALDLNPQHPKARQDMDNALRLLEKWRGMEKDDKNRQ